MDTSDKRFTLDDRRGPIWGSRGREFKSRQPDETNPPIRPSRPCIQPTFFAAVDNAQRRPLRTS
jgi:hypothetical protein